MAILPYLYFLLTPYSYPWFIIPCGILSLIAIKRVLQNNSEYLKEKNVYCLSIHFSIFLVINLINVISNFYFGGFPYSLVIINFWGLILAFKTVKTLAKDTKYDTFFFKHFLVYSSVGFALFLIYCYGFCHVDLVPVKNMNKKILFHSSHGIEKFHRINVHDVRTHKHGLKVKGKRQVGGGNGDRIEGRFKNRQEPVKKPEPVKTIKEPQPNVYKEVTHCTRDFFFGIFFFALPMTLWSILLFIHLLVHKKNYVVDLVLLNNLLLMKVKNKKNLKL